MPHRIQRQRRQGWRLPDQAICVTRPGRWGNPFVIGMDGDRAHVLASFAAYAHQRLADDPQWLAPLRGKDLACWCAILLPDGSPCPCHADLLLDLANRPDVDQGLIRT
jgi:Domain of unknown function (DUF4326)